MFLLACDDVVLRKPAICARSDSLTQPAVNNGKFENAPTRLCAENSGALFQQKENLKGSDGGV
jgi:hypothetical protein